MDYPLVWSIAVGLLLAFSGTGSASTKESPKEEKTLGRGFYLPDRNIIEDSFIGGAKIFEEALPSDCFADTDPKDAGKTTSDTTHYKDSSEFYKQVGTSLGLSASVATYFTLGGALKYVAGSGSEHSVSGTSLTVKSVKSATSLSKNCINDKPLSKKLVDALDALPKTIAKPQFDISWDKYNTFLTTYGSHLPVQVQFGAQLIQWEFAETSKQYSKKEFEVRACLDLLNSTIPVGGGVDACAGMNWSDFAQVENVYSKSKLTISGGSPETQTKLREKEGRTEKDITQLTKEGKGDFAAAISYRWKPVYEVLLQRFPDGDRNIKAKNIRMFYEGMKNFGCQLVQQGETVLRHFVLNEEIGDPTAFECRVPGEGCHDDQDCHYSFGRGCYCYGRTCIEKVVQTIHGEAREERKIRGELVRGKYEGPNKSCNWSGSCKCTVEHTWPKGEVVWSYASIKKKGEIDAADDEASGERDETEDGDYDPDDESDDESGTSREM